MKKVFTLITTLAIAVVCDAQFEKGQILFGPTLSFGGNSAKISNINIINLPPESKDNHINFGINTELIKMQNSSAGLGLRINYGLYSYKYEGTRNDQNFFQHSFSIGIAKIKFYSIAEKWLFYYNTNADLGYTCSKNNFNISTTNNELKLNKGSLSLSVEPGIAFKLRKNLLVGLKLANLFSGGYAYYENYNKNNLGEKSVEKGSDFSLNTNLTSNILGSTALNLKWIL